MAEPNWKNRTLFHGDNLDVMREMNSETIDLIATDPPFNKGKDFHATPDSLARGASFQDRWKWEEETHNEWVAKLPDDWPRVWEVINSTRSSWGDDMAAYLCFMAVRLIAMRRLLKPFGSIYLHCDPTASHYLKMLMDAIFGRNNFQNELIWRYSWGNHTAKRWNRKHDVILFYAKGKNYLFNAHEVMEKREAEVLRRLETGIPSATMAADRGKSEDKTLKLPTDVWDIPTINAMARERVGYPTQKPLALYERIIKASSDANDLVLDPFAGCATTCVAAEKLKRQWVGIDIWPEVQDVVVDRLENEDLIAPKYTRKTPEMKERYFWSEELHFTNKLPKRTDEGETDVEYLETLEKFKKEPWERLSRTAMTKHLEIAQRDKDGWVVCGGCGRQLEVQFMELDHINPRAGRGTNDITNRILLCSPCNRKKRHKLTLIGLVELNEDDEWMDNAIAAKNAQTRAENYANKIKHGQISLRDGIN